MIIVEILAYPCRNRYSLGDRRFWGVLCEFVHNVCGSTVLKDVQTPSQPRPVARFELQSLHPQVSIPL